MLPILKWGFLYPFVGNLDVHKSNHDGIPNQHFLDREELIIYGGKILILCATIIIDAVFDKDRKSHLIYMVVDIY